MTLPVSGAISINAINVELGVAGTTTASLGQASFRTLANVPSGAISMSNFYGKSNRKAVSITIASNTANYTLNTAKVSGYIAGGTDVTLTINSGVIVYSTSTGSYALSVDTSWAAGDTVTIVNNGTILGMGGKGGNGTLYYDTGKELLVYANAQPGAAGGPGLLIQRATSINNIGRISGGGGGGAAGGDISTNLIYTYVGGGGGGIGGGAGGNKSQHITAPNTYNYGGDGQPGTLTSSGSGFNTAQWWTQDKGDPHWLVAVPWGIPAGDGGSYGSAGNKGYTYYSQTAQSGSILGGAGGAAVAGNSNISWIATGTRNGAIT